MEPGPDGTRSRTADPLPTGRGGARGGRAVIDLVLAIVIISYAVSGWRQGLAAEGIVASRYEVNVAFPNFDTVVADMKARGVDAIWDGLDENGNENLCRAMERASFSVKPVLKAC